MSRFLLVLALVGIVVGIGNFVWFETEDVPSAAHAVSMFVTGPVFIVTLSYLLIRYVVIPLSAGDETVNTRVRIGIVWHTNATVTVHHDRILIDTAVTVHSIMDYQLVRVGEQRQAFSIEHSAPDLPSPVLILVKRHHPVREAIVRMAGVCT